MITNKQKPPFSWALVAVFVFVSGLVLILGLRYTSSIKERVLISRKNELKTVADLKADQIVQWRRERRGDAIVIQNSLALISQIDDYIYKPAGKSEKAAIVQWMNSFINSLGYLNGAISDDRGRIKLTVPEEDSIPGSQVPPLIPEVLKNREVIISDLHQIAPGKKVHMDMIVPLILNSEDNSRLVGLVILRIDPSKVLYPLVNTWPTQSGSSETLILRKEDDSLIYLNEVRHLSSPLLTVKRSVKEENLVGAMAVSGKEGSVTGVDYRKVPVLAEVRKIKGSDWYMVSKVDLSEINTQISGALTLIRLLILFFILAFGAVIGWAIWHQRVRFYRERYESELEREALAKHFNYILKYANDIILLIDPDLVIVEANDTAIEVYQYTRKELLGMSIYKLRLPEYNSQLEEKLSLLNETSSATYETVHRRKDGTTFPTEISARLFEIEGKKYYQSIGRDITERKSIEDRLKQMIDRYNMASVAARFAVWEYDLVNDHLIWDDRVYELYGVGREDFAPVYSSWLKTVHPDDRKSADKVIRDAIIDGKDYSAEFRIIHPDSSVRYIKAFGHIARDKEGTPQKMIGVNYDITDQKIAENLLREREFLLSESQKIGKIGSYVFDIKNMIWSSSEVLDEIFGIDGNYERDLEGWGNLVHPEEKEEMLNYVKDNVITKKNFFDKEYRIVNHKTRQIQWMYGRGALSFDEDGKAIKMIGTIQDITRRKTVENQLERSFSLLKATIESTADGLLVVDEDGNIISYNQKFAEMWNIPQEVLSTNDDTQALKFVIGQLKYPDVFMEIVQNLYKSPEKISFDVLEFSDGKVFERYSQPQKVNDKIVGRVWSFRDVTQTKIAERQLINAKEKAEESDRLKTAFLHNISHEIRTPMNAIVGFTALLDDPEIDKDTRSHFIEIITESTNQLLSLISDIVDISNIETGQVNLSYSEVNLNSTITDLYEKFNPVALKQKLIFHYNAGIPDEKAIINTDREKLIQILSHLLSNAFKFTKQGTVMIGYRVTDNNLELFIKDTGIGIPADKQKRIFDRFYQIENDSSREFSGAGLGLSICQAYAELLGGSIGVISTPGKGSEFYFTHPL